MKPYKFESKDYRQHLAAHKRAMGQHMHDYDGKGPAYVRVSHRPLVADAHADLIRYAAALGRKRGHLPEDLSHWVAYGQRNGTGGTGYVTFTPGHEEHFKRTYEWRADPRAEAIRIDVRFLDWVPAPYTEELIDQEQPRHEDQEHCLSHRLNNAFRERNRDGVDYHNGRRDANQRLV